MSIAIRSLLSMIVNQSLILHILILSTLFVYYKLKSCNFSRIFMNLRFGDNVINFCVCDILYINSMCCLLYGNSSILEKRYFELFEGIYLMSYYMRCHRVVANYLSAVNKKNYKYKKKEKGNK